jgi:hypothetical protein
MAVSQGFSNMPNHSKAVSVGVLSRLDRWMQLHPGHPRVVPFVVYCVFLSLSIYLVQPHALSLWPVVCLLQSALVLGLLWRYRKLMPELTLSFHWLAVPVGVAVAAMWVAVGLAVVRVFPATAPDGEHYFEQMSPLLRYTSLALDLLGIAIVVPLLEEPFVRSFVLRGLQKLRPTMLAAAQFGSVIPLIDRRVQRSSLGRRAERHGPIFAEQFKATPLGKLSFFGVFASTLVFTLYHVQRDWPAAIVCGIAYCLLLAATRHKGLGPLIWTHGITNAALFAYCAWTGDWQFL